MGGRERAKNRRVREWVRLYIGLNWDMACLTKVPVNDEYVNVNVNVNYDYLSCVG